MTTKKRVRCTVRATTSSAQHLRLRRVPPRRRKAFPATGAAIYQGSPRLSARRSSNRNVPLASPCLRRATPFTFQTPFVDRPLAVVPQIPIKVSLASAANAAELASIAATPSRPITAHGFLSKDATTCTGKRAHPLARALALFSVPQRTDG
jgi:hypothetical protein